MFVELEYRFTRLRHFLRTYFSNFHEVHFFLVRFLASPIDVHKARTARIVLEMMRPLSFIVCFVNHDNIIISSSRYFNFLTTLYQDAVVRDFTRWCPAPGLGNSGLWFFLLVIAAMPVFPAV